MTRDRRGPMTSERPAARAALPAIAIALIVVAAIGQATARALPAPLRVCADPNNLPFSNTALEGFENELASLIAHDFGTRVEYVWWAQRRGFIRSTLAAGVCDVALGVPAAFDLAWTTRPYYRSSYVFVSRRDRGLGPLSLDDPRLGQLSVGVQMIGDDFSNSPPAHALSARGVISNVVGFSVLGDYGQPNPPARIVEAVSSGKVDVAIVWGPLAGFFAALSPVPLDVTRVSPAMDPPYLPFVFDVSMAVRRGDAQLHDRLDRFIAAHQRDIAAVLDRFHIPRVPSGGGRP
jgi:mxaJ protein